MPRTFYLLGRVALGAQRPIVVKVFLEQSFGRSVCLSVCPVHCGKTADRIRMSFGIIGRTGPGMRQRVGFHFINIYDVYAVKNEQLLGTLII